MRHAGHEPAPGGSRTSRGSRSPWGHADGPGWMALRQGPRRARQPHAGAAARPSARIEPGREYLAVSARELVVEPRVRLLPRHRRSLLRRVEQAHRPALAHHVHRPPGLGQCMRLSAGWYEIRRRLLLAFEHAENCPDPNLRRRLLTFVLVGGGPTGVELAGSTAELARFALKRDFRNIDPTKARIILVEAGPQLLTGFHPKLASYAKAALERLRVEVRLNTPVEMIDVDGVVARGERIDASVVIWCAGVKATPIAACLGAPTTRKGAITVAPDLSVPGTSNIFAIGDVAGVNDQAGKPLPLLAPVAKQEGAYVARVIRSQLEGKAPPPAFRYRDPGSLAIIGRSAAVVDFGFVQITGFVGWLVWAFAHIFFLIGFRSKIAVFLEWSWQWVTYARGARLIVGPAKAGRDFQARPPPPSSPVVFPPSAAPPKS